MRYPIDVVFVNSSNRVVALEKLLPWRMSKIHLRANKVIELPEAVIERSQTQIGDEIQISR